MVMALTFDCVTSTSLLILALVWRGDCFCLLLRPSERVRKPLHQKKIRPVFVSQHLNIITKVLVDWIKIGVVQKRRGWLWVIRRQQPKQVFLQDVIYLRGNIAKADGSACVMCVRIHFPNRSEFDRCQRKSFGDSYDA
jgi:hypothetical protein